MNGCPGTDEPLFVDASRGLALDSNGHVRRVVIVSPTVDPQVPRFRALHLLSVPLDQDDEKFYAEIGKRIYGQVSRAEQQRKAKQAQHLERMVQLSEEIGYEDWAKV